MAGGWWEDKVEAGGGRCVIVLKDGLSGIWVPHGVGGRGGRCMLNQVKRAART